MYKCLFCEGWHVSKVGDHKVTSTISAKKRDDVMDRLDTLPTTFCRFRKDTLTGVNDNVMFSLCVDFIRPGEKLAATVNTWLAQMAEEDASREGLDVKPRSIVTPRPVTNDKDKADLARRTAERYFDILRREEGLDMNEDIGFYFRDVCLRAWHVTDRHITILRYNHDYLGGAHGYHTENLVTYDPIRKRVVCWDDLLRPECKEQVLNVFYQAVPQNSKYMKYCADYIRYFSKMFIMNDDDGNPENKMVIPRPGLGEKGVVFSFQPYQLSGFPDGTFHINVPYHQLTPYLTDEAKRLLGM